MKREGILLKVKTSSHLTNRSMAQFQKLANDISRHNSLEITNTHKKMYDQKL